MAGPDEPADVRRPRVALAEDSVILREGLVRLLGEAGYEVTCAVGDAEALLASVRSDPPELVMVDVRLPPAFIDEGLRAAVAVRAEQPGTPVLVVSQHVTVAHLDVLLGDGAGGVGYLLKDRVASVAELVDATHRVLSGATVLDPEVVAQLFVRRSSDPLDRLTPRERDVLGLLAEGRSNAAIAERLRVSGGAVEKHVSGIFDKLALPPSDDDNRRVLAVLAYLRASPR
ncbi:MAG: response regulator transcription factor [Dermatophilaceae bacterium]